MILCLLGFLSTGIYALSEPAARWIEMAPQNLHQVEGKLKARSQEFLTALEQAYGKFAQITDLETTALPQPYKIQRPSLTSMLISSTPEVVGGIGGVAVISALLFFLLAFLSILSFDSLISAEGSDCEVLVIPRHEERMISQHCRRLLTNLENTP